MSKILTARNTQRAYLAESVPMGAALVSDIADFHEMVIGAVQANWSGNDAVDGELELWMSCDGVSFDRIDGSLRDLDQPYRCRVWHLQKIGFRYVRLEYTPKSVTTGTLEAFAIGKIS